jgi:hypothetical protein
MDIVTRLTSGVDLSIAIDFDDAKVLTCSMKRQRGLEAAKEIAVKVVGAELGLTSISEIKQPLWEILDYRRHISIVVKKTCYQFGCNTWYKIDDELESIIEVGLNRSTRNRRNIIDNLTCRYNLFGG